MLVPSWSWWQLPDDEPFVLPVPVGAAERVTWSLSGKHDLLFSLTGGQLGGNVRLLCTRSLTSDPGDRSDLLADEPAVRVVAV